jgi:hypothetical protein
MNSSNKIVVIINGVECLFSEKMIETAAARYQKHIAKEQIKKEKAELKAMKMEEK